MSKCTSPAGNVLLDSRDPMSTYFTAKLADFGFARRLGKAYCGVPPSGNYAYLAPEVMEGKEHSQVHLPSLVCIPLLHQEQHRARMVHIFST